MNMQNALQSKKAIIYVRVSTDEQVDNYSLDTQEELCRKEAERLGYEITSVFREEGRSAKTIVGRPTLMNMLTYCYKNKKKIGALFVYRIDRVSREMGDYITIRKKLYSYNIKLISTREPTGDSPTDIFMEHVIAASAQWDNAIRAERTKVGMYARFKSGLPNAVPFGYIQKDGMASKDPLTFDTMKMAWQLMASGTKSIKEVAKIIDTNGLKLRGRHPKAKDFYRLFRKKFYCGILTSKTYKEEILGQHEPMITLQQFKKVQQLIDAKKPQNMIILKRGRNNVDFPFKRHIRCSKCGHFMCGAWSQGHTKKYPYYMCGVRCVSTSINAYGLHEKLEKFVKKYPLSDKNKAEMMNLFQTKIKSNMNGADYRHKVINEKIIALKEQRVLVVKKNIEGIYSDEVLKEQNERIRQEIADFEKERKRVILYKEKSKDVIESFKELLNDFYMTFKRAETDQKKILLHYLFPSGLVWNYNGSFVVNSIKTEKVALEQMSRDAFDVLVEIVEERDL